MLNNGIDTKKKSIAINVEQTNWTIGLILII